MSDDKNKLKKRRFESLAVFDWIHLILIIAIMLISLYKFLVLVRSNGATLFGDELLYKENAESLFNRLPFDTAKYPPLYSIILIPALFFENWYDAMIFTNGILSSLLLIPVWLISKEFLSRRMVAIAVLLAALLPFQAIYPQFLMSENLFLGLFLLAVLFAYKGRKGGKTNALIFGIVMAFCLLTKFLFLPAIPFLVLYWFVSGHKPDADKEKYLFQNGWLKLLLIAAGLVLPLVPWVLYMSKGGYSILEAFGAAIVGKINFSELTQQEAPLSSLFRWIFSYIAYLLLSIAPLITAILFYPWKNLLDKSERKANAKEIEFITFSIVISGLYILIASFHSFRASYNYPTPAYILGRYLMHLTPLFIIIGMISIERIKQRVDSTKIREFLLAFLISFGIVVSARWLLYINQSWNFPGWFADILANAPDSLYYKTTILPTAIVYGLLIGFVFLRSLFPRIDKQNTVLVVVMIGSLLICQLDIFSNASKRALNNTIGAHGRQTAEILWKDMEVTAPLEQLVYRIPGLDPIVYRHMLLFWDVYFEEGAVVDIDTGSLTNIDKTMFEPRYIVTSDLLDVTILGTYNYENLTYYVYKVDAILSPEEPMEIVDFNNIKSIKAGVTFNEQPSGESAFWLITKNATPNTVIVFNGQALDTTFGSPEELTAILPNEFFSQPGTVVVYLYDIFTGARSESITIMVN